MPLYSFSARVNKDFLFVLLSRALRLSLSFFHFFGRPEAETLPDSLVREIHACLRKKVVPVILCRLFNCTLIRPCYVKDHFSSVRTGKIRCATMNRSRERGKAFSFHALFYSRSHSGQSDRNGSARRGGKLPSSLAGPIYCSALHAEETHAPEIVMITSEGKRAK